MCGILGIVEPGIENDRLAEKMLDVIAHRGPDGSDYFSNNGIVVGQRRLAIIDLVTGDQPMFNDDKTYCIVHNGEIYNYLELKEKLISEGVSFRTDSDTEVVLKAFETWGENCVKDFNGIFAFAILNVRDNELFIARDHFGIKPLHYFHDNDLLVFGSEQKSIIEHPRVPRRLNKTALHLHLNLRYTQGENTLFEGIKRLPPAHFLTFKDGKLTIRKYWELKSSPNLSMREDDAIDGIHHFIKQAIKRQLVSDVPIGVYLSGGLDSSTIVQKMHELNVPEINTFTLGFNEPTDEFPDAKLVSQTFQTNHSELSLSLNPLDEMEKVIWHAEEPKINLLQGFNMSKFVQPHVKVVLGGLGGDELFAGYDIHKFIYPMTKWHKRIPKFIRSIFRMNSEWLAMIQQGSGILKWDEYRRGIQMLLATGDQMRSYLIMRNVWDFDNGFFDEIYSPDFASYQRNHGKRTWTEFDDYFKSCDHLNSFDQVLFAEMQSKMINDYLLVEDRMSMAHSIEERVPFLDLDLVKFGLSIPYNLKIKNNQTKYLFRKAMSKSLPDKIVRKKKWGFTVNPYLQFKKDLKKRVEQDLTRSFIEEQGIFNYNYIQKILDYPAHPKLRWHYNYIWILLGLKIWQEQFSVSID